MIYAISLSLIILSLPTMMLIKKLYKNHKLKKAKEKKELAKKHLFIKYLTKNQSKVELWQKNNPDELPPIWWNDVAGEWIWINRQQRKQLKQKRLK